MVEAPTVATKATSVGQNNISELNVDGPPSTICIQVPWELNNNPP